MNARTATEILLSGALPYEARRVVKDRFISKARMSDLMVRAREQREMAHRYFRTGCPNQGRSWMRSALTAFEEFNRLRKEL